MRVLTLVAGHGGESLRRVRAKIHGMFENFPKIHRSLIWLSSCQRRAGFSFFIHVKSDSLLSILLFSLNSACVKEILIVAWKMTSLPLFVCLNSS